jgi:PKD repeat protein
MAAIADGTAGRMTVAPDQSTFVSQLQSAIVAAGSAPVADAGGPYSGLADDPVVLNAGGSRDSTERITAYDWDFDGDGRYDATTSTPTVTHSYPAGDYSVVLRTRTASGLAATATSQVTIAPRPAVPATPTGFAATPGDSSATLHWNAGDALADWFTITDGGGAVIDRVAAGPHGEAPAAGWADPDLTNGMPYAYRVSAGNPAGESSPTATVTVTPAVPASNHAPVAAPDAFSTDNRTPLVVPAPGVLANDTDPDASSSLTAVLITAPRHGTLALAADGSLQYTATSRFVGTDTFSYRTVDEHGATSDPATVTISVTAAAAAQRLLLVAGCRPPVVLVGPVVTGAFTVRRHGATVLGVTGTGSVRDRQGRPIPVSITVTYTGRLWSTTISVQLPAGRVTLTGTGRVQQIGALTVGTFRGGRTSFGFTIVTPAR